MPAKKGAKKATATKEATKTTELAPTDVESTPPMENGTNGEDKATFHENIERLNGGATTEETSANDKTETATTKTTKGKSAKTGTTADNSSIKDLENGGGDKGVMEMAKTSAATKAKPDKAMKAAKGKTAAANIAAVESPIDEEATEERNGHQVGEPAAKKKAPKGKAAASAAPTTTSTRPTRKGQRS